MITAGIQQLVVPELPSWAKIVPMRLLGRNVGAVVTSFGDEQQRRANCGLGALNNSALLRVLFQLPHGISVPSRHLSNWERGVLARSPHGVAERRRGTVTRLACPPVKVELVVVNSRNWRCGIHSASQYSPFCRRVLVLPSMPSERSELENLELEARIYGIGVIATRHVADGWLLPPAPFKPRRFTSGLWLFHERAYAGMLVAPRADASQAYN
jgi:hypothetical protein